jgi:hypothetical protein
MIMIVPYCSRAGPGAPVPAACQSRAESLSAFSSQAVLVWSGTVTVTAGPCRCDSVPVECQWILRSSVRAGGAAAASEARAGLNL